MKKFIAQTVFEIYRDPSKAIEFDVQYRLVTAVDFYSALLKAISHAQSQEGVVTPMNGPDLYWRFIGITNLYNLDSVRDGEEIFTQTHQTQEPNLYIRFVKQRTMAIQAQNLMCE